MTQPQEIPIEIKNFVESTEVYDEVEKIGTKFNLHIDQMGELASEIRSVLLGINKPADFSDHISHRLEIDEETAKEITEVFNTEVLKTIRTKLQSTAQSSDLSTLERVGGFSLETSHTPDGSAKGMPPVNLPTGINKLEKNYAAPTESRESMISSLEDPGGMSVKQVPNSPIKSNPTPNKQLEQHTEPLADHLLKNVSAQPLQKVVQKAPISVPRQGQDNYREPIE